MGEWSEHFEQFPEENPANYVNGRFDPKGAEALRAQQAAQALKQKQLDAQIAAVIKEHSKPPTKAGT